LVISELNLRNFRNLSETSLVFAEKGHLIIGENGQGKTNLLEAIYYFTVFRSFRQATDRECIKFGKDFFLISAKWRDEHGSFEQASAGFDGKTKKVIFDSERVRTLSRAFGKFKSVVLTPDDISIIQHGPAERRKYLDIVLSIISPVYLARLKRYRKALASRNHILRSYSFRVEHIRPWEEQMAGEGAWLILERLNYLGMLEPFYSETYKRLSSNESSGIKYNSRIMERFDGRDKSAPEYWELQKILVEVFETKRGIERSRGTTLNGPHTDDIIFEINGRRMRAFGSQGQQRTAVICLKIAEANLLHQRLSINPVLLMDDIFAELDRQRSEKLLEELLQKHQSFITAPRQEAFIETYTKLPVKYIADGVITE
jgi:DNA replication and repair protein RecF